MTTITVELNEDDLKQLVAEELRRTLNAEITEKDIRFEVKTKQNWRAAEWETGAFRATINKRT